MSRRFTVYKVERTIDCEGGCGGGDGKQCRVMVMGVDKDNKIAAISTPGTQ